MTIEEFLAASNECTTREELARQFVRAVESTGYQNVTFVRVGSGGFVDTPVMSIPGQFLDSYITAGCEREDAVLVEAARSSQPFFWNEVADQRPLSAGEIRTFGICREVGVHSGFSIPFHGPDGIVDLIGVSLRDQTKVDSAAAGRIVALASILRWRYWQISSRAPDAPLDPTLVHAGGPPGMNSAHCRALVMVDLAVRRRSMGLHQMMRQIGDYVSDADLAFLLSWGYVVERADDNSFTYDFALSALGERHVASCTIARMHRRRAWGSEVPRYERPRANENS